ncbi:endonuclease [Absicoccus porci]|uniref:Endonuclease n=1 Tax=Absicoccus porci TaxID=2486576 RepID=A0A3N0I2E4_9FIRM|nr:type I restriction endonuclease [Absicoccus porci]RNM30670.1 endonuclease [Absicoccus porci]
MELQEQMYQLSERIKSLKDSIQTEEATKQSFILPFFQILGYDVFNPLEFVPEFTADVGIKKREKVDYAILREGQPIILIEAKSCNEKLDNHDSQLFRYFGTTKSRFAILTNGIEYRFYSDLDQPNVMDSKPFYTLNMEELSDQSISYLKNFISDNLNISSILGTASDLKYLGLLKTAFKNVVENPSDDFIRLILNDGVYDGLKNQRVIEKFRPLTKRAINQYINDQMSNKFKETLANANSETEADTSDNKTADEDEAEPVKSKIVTTYDELNAFAIVKAILRKNVSGSRITYKDTESYFGVLFDNNTRKWICRIHLDSRKKYIEISDENKKSVRHDINSLDNIYDLEDELLKSLQKYL